MDLLEEAGIAPPPPPRLSAEWRPELDRVIFLQSQFKYIFAFLFGLAAGAVVAWLIGYGDVVVKFVGWIFTSSGLAVVFSILNTQKLSTFRCPRCGELFFSGYEAQRWIFAHQCGNCGLPLQAGEAKPLPVPLES